MAEKQYFHPESLTILRLSEVRSFTGLSRSTIYLRIKLGEFPTAVSLGDRAVGWLAHEIQEWLRARVHATRGTAAAEAE